MQYSRFIYIHDVGIVVLLLVIVAYLWYVTPTYLHIPDNWNENRDTVQVRRALRIIQAKRISCSSSDSSSGSEARKTCQVCNAIPRRHLGGWILMTDNMNMVHQSR
jgi:hypothetical protein